MPPRDIDVPGLIEEEVKDARLVDSGLSVLRRYLHNTPSFDPERRRFLRYVAGLAGWLALQPTKASGADTMYLEKEEWKPYLMEGDLIRGPSLLIHHMTFRPSDFNHHLSQGMVIKDNGIGAVDYSVPIGTPVTPTGPGIVYGISENRMGGNVLYISHGSVPNLFGSGYVHLAERFIKDRSTRVNLNKIIALSGDTGRGYFGGIQPPHLHFFIFRREHDGTYVERNGKKLKWYIAVKPGIDPFTLGIDGGRPVYWDTKTEMGPFPSASKQVYLERLLDSLGERVKEAEIDNQTKHEIIRRKNPEDLRNYLGREVLQKSQGPDGKVSYKYLPGHFMYTLMLEVFAYTSRQPFIAVLPFPHPLLVDFYKTMNPNVPL